MGETLFITWNQRMGKDFFTSENVQFFCYIEEQIIGTRVVVGLRCAQSNNNDYSNLNEMIVSFVCLNKSDLVFLFDDCISATRVIELN